jgi:hypothetical protein
VQLVVAHEAHAIDAEPRLAERGLSSSDQRVRVGPDHALALAAADQHFETLHRYIDLERLNPFDRDAHCVVATQVVQLSAVFTLDRLHPRRLAPPVGVWMVPQYPRQPGKSEMAIWAKPHLQAESA